MLRVDNYKTVPQAAVILGIQEAAVRVAIMRGSLKSKKFGRDNFIHEDELERYARENLGKRGRKPKS